VLTMIKNIVMSIVVLFLLISISVAQSTSNDSIELIATLCMGDSADYFQIIEAAGDMNDDGFDDIWVVQTYGADGDTGRRKLYLFHGGNPMDTIPDMVLKDTIHNIANVGDMNLDGYDDFIIFHGNSILYYGLHYGGPEFSTIPALKFPVHNQDWINFGLQNTICGGFDMDSDGKPDIVIGEPGPGIDFSGKAYFYSSNPVLDTVYDIEFEGDGNFPEYYDFGLEVAYLPNINGNNYLAINYSGGLQDINGRVFLFKTGASFDNQPDYIIPPPGGIISETFGSLLENVMDINGDGYTDFVISTLAGANAYLYFGGNSFDTLHDITITPSFEKLEGQLDINNDSYPDFIIGEQPFTGRAVIYFGGPDVDGYGDLYINIPSGVRNFGGYLKSLDDVNGDNIDDFAISGLGTESYYPGKVCVFAGYDENSTGIDDSQNRVIPKGFKLYQNYPNPFNSTTNIKFDLPYKSKPEIEIIDISGKLIRKYKLGILYSGTHSISWDGLDDAKQIVGSGLYLYRLKFNNIEISKKMLYIK